MILISSIILLLSVFIQGTISNYIGYIYTDLSIFSTVYVLIALLILNPYFENKKKYFVLLITFGIIVDVVYTDTFILNTCLFLLCYYVSKLFHFLFPYNCLTISVSNVLCVSVYHIVSFLFLNILKYDIYSFSFLGKILSHSILMTIIYSNIIYIIMVLIQKKFQLRGVK